MTREDKKIAIAKFCGVQPRRLWRYWFDKDRTHGEICILTKEKAILSRDKQIKMYSDLGCSCEYASDVEEYDDWSHAPNYFGCLNEIAKAEESAGLKPDTAEERAEYFGVKMGLW